MEPSTPSAEECARFKDSTRLFTKNQKTWTGRQKPMEMRMNQEKPMYWPKYLREMTFTCTYCNEDHKGPFEMRHYKKCKGVSDDDREERWQIPDNVFNNSQMGALPLHANKTQPLIPPPGWKFSEDLASERVLPN